MELPPPPDALVDTLKLVFSKSTGDLPKAEWAVVDKAAYMEGTSGEEARKAGGTIDGVDNAINANEGDEEYGYQRHARALTQPRTCPVLHNSSVREGQF